MNNTNRVMTLEYVDDDLEKKEQEKMAASNNAKPTGLKVPPSNISPRDSLEQMQQLKQEASAKAPPAVNRYFMDKEAALTPLVAGGITKEKLQTSRFVPRPHFDEPMNNTNRVMTLEYVDDDLEKKEQEKMAASNNAKPAGLKVPPSNISPRDSLEQMQQLKQDATESQSSRVGRYVRQMSGLNRRSRRLNRSSSSTRPTSSPGATRIPGVISNDIQVPPPAENNRRTRRLSRFSSSTRQTSFHWATRIPAVINNDNQVSPPAEKNYIDDGSPFTVEARLVKEEESEAVIRERILNEMGPVTQAQVVDVTHRVNRKRYIAAGIIFLLILGAILYATLNNRGDEASPSASSSSSLSPSASPSLSRLGYLHDLLAPNSTQGDEAVELLADTDPAMLPRNTSPEIFRNRYALVVLYYSTNGPGWFDNTTWLSDSSVCDWIGVSCTSDFVTSLDFGKLLEHHNVHKVSC
jgi:hypothetical protein